MKKRENKGSTITFRLTISQKQELVDICDKLDMSITTLITKLLVEHNAMNEASIKNEENV